MESRSKLWKTERGSWPWDVPLRTFDKHFRNSVNQHIPSFQERQYGVSWCCSRLQIVAKEEADDCRSWRVMSVRADRRWKLYRSEFILNQSIRAVVVASFLNTKSYASHAWPGNCLAIWMTIKELVSCQVRQTIWKSPVSDHLKYGECLSPHQKVPNLHLPAFWSGNDKFSINKGLRLTLHGIFAYSPV